MSRPLFSGSTLERVRMCSGSQVLPHARDTSPAAERGSAIHAYLAGVLALGREAALLLVPPEWRAACEAIPLDALPHVNPAGYVAEVAFAYDVDAGTSRELGRDLTRAQAEQLYATLGESEVPVTIDVGALTADGEGVVVADAKTGRGPVVPAARNAQLLLGALPGTRAGGRDRAVVMSIRLRDEGRPWFDGFALDEIDLAAGAAELRKVAARVRAARAEVAAGRRPDVALGEHCKYCPARASCDAQTGLLRQLMQAPAGWREDFGGELTPARAAAAYRLWRLVDEVVKRAGGQLFAYATEHPIDLGDGLVFGPTQTKRESVDGAVARAVLTERFGADVAHAALSYETSKAAIKEALRAEAQKTGTPLAQLEREALELIRHAGGVDTKVSATTKEHRPKKAKEAA